MQSRTYPPCGPHDTACNRVPQRFRNGHWLGYGVVAEDFRPCPLRPEKELFPGEGPHATAWLAGRGDTCRLLIHTGTAFTGVGRAYRHLQAVAQIESYVDALEAELRRLAFEAELRRPTS